MARGAQRHEGEQAYAESRAYLLAHYDAMRAAEGFLDELDHALVLDFGGVSGRHLDAELARVDTATWASSCDVRLSAMRAIDSQHDIEGVLTGFPDGALSKGGLLRWRLARELLAACAALDVPALQAAFDDRSAQRDDTGAAQARYDRLLPKA